MRYGPYERNVLDLWRARAPGPTPLLVYIHGGAWIGGDKQMVANPKHDGDLLSFLLAHGVSVASVNYRYSRMAPLPAPVHDAARAVQFLRSKAREWNLIKNRFAAAGTSAGACTSLWLAYHDDLADPTSSDPVARESTRVCAAVGYSAQTSIDPQVIVPWVGDQVLNHRMIWCAVGAKSREDAMAHYAQWAGLYREFSPINFVTRDDPPVMVVYPTLGALPAPDPGHAIHHAMFGVKLKEKADAVGAICRVRIKDQAKTETPGPDEFLLGYLTQP